MFIPVQARQLLLEVGMRSLFFKIFVWFWLAMTAVGMALVVSTETTSNERDLRRFMIGRPITMYAHTAARIYEHEGATALSDYLTSVNKVARVGVFMFDEQGKELLGRAPPPEIKDLAAKAAMKYDPEPSFSGNTSLVAQSIRTPAGHRYVLVTEIEPHHDVCLINGSAQTSAAFRIAHGVEGFERLHLIIAQRQPELKQVLVALETARGLLVHDLLRSGYQVYAINPKAVSTWLRVYDQAVNHAVQGRG